MFHWKQASREISIDGYYEHPPKQTVPGRISVSESWAQNCVQEIRIMWVLKSETCWPLSHIKLNPFLGFLIWGGEVLCCVCWHACSQTLQWNNLGCDTELKLHLEVFLQLTEKHRLQLLNQLCSKLRCWSRRNDGSFNIFWKGLEYKYYLTTTTITTRGPDKSSSSFTSIEIVCFLKFARTTPGSLPWVPEGKEIEI